MQVMRAGSVRRRWRMSGGAPGIPSQDKKTLSGYLSCRCLATDHWLDQCRVTTDTLCTVCYIPGHLPSIHQANNFRQRKLVIDTFGWLAFKDWFMVQIATCYVYMIWLSLALRI